MVRVTVRRELPALPGLCCGHGGGGAHRGCAAVGTGGAVPAGREAERAAITALLDLLDAAGS
jgi:hypothetical protein